MARLPITPSLPDYTDLGQSPVPDDRQQIVEDNSGQILGAGISGAADTLINARQQAQAKQDAAAKNLARMKAGNAGQAYGLQVKGIQQNISDAIQDKTLPYDQAPAVLQKQIAAIPTPQVPNLDPEAQESLNGTLQDHATVAQLEMHGVVRQAQKDDYKDQFAQALDLGQKAAGLPGANIDAINGNIESLRPQALNAGIPSAQVDEAIQNFKDRNWMNQATQRTIESRGSLPALQQMQNDLTSENGFYAGKLDTVKRNILLSEVTNDQSVLQNRIDLQQDKREAKAGAALNYMDAQIATGVPASPDMWQTLLDQAKGTSYEGEVEQRLAAEKKVQDVLKLPPAQQIQYVNEQQLQLHTQGGSMLERANLNRLQSAVTQNMQMMQSNPFLFAATRTGAALPQSIDISTPQGQQALGGQIADRMATLTALRKQYGPLVGMQPLLPQESTQIASMLNSAPVQQKAAILATLHQSVGDDAAYEAIMHQVAPNYPVAAIAGTMVGNAKPNQQPVWFDPNFAKGSDGGDRQRDVARILNGESLLNPASKADMESGKGGIKGGFPIPADVDAKTGLGLRPLFIKTAGDMFRDRPDLAEAYYSTFKAADAGLRADAGDLKGDWNPAIEKQALQIALGNHVDLNGHTVPVPTGMDPSRFPVMLNNAVAAVATANGAPADWRQRMDGYGLRELGMVGSGRYVLTNGNVPIGLPNGKGPFVVDLRNQYLPGRVNHSPPPPQPFPRLDLATGNPP